MPLSVIKPLTVLTGSLKDEDCLKSTLIIRFEIMKHYFLSVQVFHASKMIMILNNYLAYSLMMLFVISTFLTLLFVMNSLKVENIKTKKMGV